MSAKVSKALTPSPHAYVNIFQWYLHLPLLQSNCVWNEFDLREQYYFARNTPGNPLLVLSGHRFKLMKDIGKYRRWICIKTDERWEWCNFFIITEGEDIATMNIRHTNALRKKVAKSESYSYIWRSLIVVGKPILKYVKQTRAGCCCPAWERLRSYWLKTPPTPSVAPGARYTVSCLNGSHGPGRLLCAP